jgi:hypothetical protein
MVFDIRGRRKVAVKVVYAVLAVLMGLSLFLVVGPLNIGELFGGGESGNAAKGFEEQAERAERKLKREPQNTDLLVSATRARVNAANQLYPTTTAPGEPRIPTVEVVQQLQLASNDWSRYLKATKEPTVGMAQLMSQQLFVLAQYGRTFQESQSDVEAAAEAQQIVVDKQPTLNSFTTLAIFTGILGENKKTQHLVTEAKKLAPAKSQREEIDKLIERYEKAGREFRKARGEAEAAEKAVGGSGKQALEGSPGSALSGAGLGGGSLGE